MRRIRIISPPESLRFSLPYMNAYNVGLELPLAPVEDLERYPPPEAGVTPHDGTEFLVLRSDLVQALKDKKRGEAALFWERNHWGMYISLSEKDCELVE